MNLKDRARRLKLDIPAVFLAMRKPETPRRAKVLAAVTIGYALSPIDLIPDFIPVLGYLDDVILLPALVAWTIRMIPEDVMVICRREAEGLWDAGKPVRFIYALPVILVWFLIGAGIYRWLRG